MTPLPATGEFSLVRENNIAWAIGSMGFLIYALYMRDSVSYTVGWVNVVLMRVLGMEEGRCGEFGFFLWMVFDSEEGVYMLCSKIV